MNSVFKISAVLLVPGFLLLGCGKNEPLNADGDGIYTSTGQRMAKDDFAEKLKNANEFHLLYKSAQQFASEGAYNQAIAEFQRAYQIAALKPEQAWMKLEMARIYEIQGKYAEAIECYEELVQKTQSKLDVELGNSKIQELSKKIKQQT